MQQCDGVFMLNEERKEKMSVSLTIPLTKSMRENLDVASGRTGRGVAEIVREAIDNWFESTPTALEDRESLPLRILTKAPCGPYDEAVEQSGYFDLSPDIADELGARESDVVVRTSGDSMAGAGIPDGALLLMRPLLYGRQPRIGRPALVQIAKNDGSYVGTIKHWMGDGELHDGDGEVMPLPEGVREVHPVAEAVGIISLL